MLCAILASRANAPGGLKFQTRAVVLAASDQLKFASPGKRLSSDGRVNRMRGAKKDPSNLAGASWCGAALSTEPPKLDGGRRAQAGGSAIFS
jgi:hypothetical protein